MILMRKILERKPTEIWGKTSEHGNSTMDILCPFCEKVTTAFIWSISANGKMCETPNCNTILYRGEAHKLFPKLTDKQRSLLIEIHQYKCTDIGNGWYPSKHTLNSLQKKGFINYGKHIVSGDWKGDVGYYVTELGRRYAEDEKARLTSHK